MPSASLPLLPGRGPLAPRDCTPCGGPREGCSELTLGSWAPLPPFSPSRFGLDLRAGFLGSLGVQGQGSTPMCSAYSNQTSGSAAHTNIHLHGQSQGSAAPPSQTHTHMHPQSHTDVHVIIQNAKVQTHTHIHTHHIHTPHGIHTHGHTQTYTVRHMGTITH